MVKSGNMSHAESTTGLRTAVPVTAGLTLFWAWTHLMVFKPAGWSESSDNVAELSWLVSNTVSLVTLAAIYLLGRRHASLFGHPGLVWPVAILGAVASALAAAPVAGQSEIPLKAFVACVGVGSACNMVLIACWALPYTALRDTVTRTESTIVAMVGSFIGYLALSTLPAPAAPVVMAALVLASAACYTHAPRRADRHSESSSFIGANQQSVTRPPVLVLGFILVFSVPLNFLQSRGIGFVATEGGFSPAFALALALLAASCAAEMACLHRGWSVFALTTVLLLSFALLSTALVGDVDMTAVSGVALAGYFLFLSVTYLQLGRCASEETGGNPVCVFAAGMLANTVGLLLGTLLGVIAQTVSVSFANVVTLAIVYGLFILGTALLPRKMKQLLLNQREEPRDKEPKNRYVADMVQSINKQCGRVTTCFGLTEREGTVLGYLVRGWNLQMIAEEEHLTRNTVKTHVTHIYQKLGVHTREELVLVVESVEE